MQSILHYLAPPSTCGYLPDQEWSMEYELVLALSPDEYMNRLRQGWRRFGAMMFRPRCATCRQCLSLRVLVDHFHPNRSQRRAAKENRGEVELRIGKPEVSRAKLDLYDRFHAFQCEFKDWPEHPAKDAESYCESFVNNPFPIEEWCYYLDDRLVGVGYVDALPAGLSAIYFFYDPDLRHRSLGTWNVLNVIDETRRRKLPHAYLGFYVKDCLSLAYKATFVPNQVLRTDGTWGDFRG